MRLLERTRRAIAHEYGLPLETVAPRQAFVSRTSKGATARQSLHADESSYDTFHYSSVLYLSTQGEHFEGGSFAFSDPPPPLSSSSSSSGERRLSELAPQSGLAVLFSSGWENMHRVQPMVSGCRHALPAFFVTRPPEADRSEEASWCDGDAAIAEFLWCTLLDPETEDDVRMFMKRWHDALA